jgi:hypothetical protein
MGYFLIRSSEDGISINGPLTEAELLKRVEPEEKGGPWPKFHAKVPHIDKGCWAQKDGEQVLLIIKGDVVTPEVVQTVTTLRFP